MQANQLNYEFLPLTVAAEYLKISRSTLYKHTSAGNITYYKPHGKLILFKKSDLDAWIQKGMIPSNDLLDQSNKV